MQPQAAWLGSTNGALDKIVEAVNDSKADPSVWISKKGLKLRLKEVSAFVGMEAMSNIPEPEIPRFYDSDAERERENPLDPHYLALVEQSKQAKGVMAMNVNIALGTEIIEIPHELEAVGSKDWSNVLDEITNGGVKVPESGANRYIAWLRFYALVGMEFVELSNAIMRFSGVVSEEDISKAMSSFPSNEVRSTDSGVSAEEGSEPTD